MKVNVQQLFKALILAAFALVILKLHMSGDITKFINPKYSMLSQIAAVIFLFLTIIQAVRSFEKHDHSHEHCDCTHEHEHTSMGKKWINYSIIIFPLITAFFFSPVVLDSSIAAKKGTIFTKKSSNENEIGDNTNKNLPDEKDDTSNDTIENEGSIEDTDAPESVETPSNGEGNNTSTEQQPLENNNFMTSDEYNKKMDELEKLNFIHMKDNVYSAYYETMHMAPEVFEGKRIKVLGFVYREEGFLDNEVVIARFMISHCVADASIVGFLALLDDASKYETDTWVEIEGVIKLTQYNDMQLPAIVVESLKEIDEPEEPYIFPVLTKN
jgi:putative membrane protein